MYMSGFNVNDEVIHCREGLSTIIDVKNMNGKDYFLVQVNRISSETFYVPVDSAGSIIRTIMSIKQADELLQYIKKISKEFNTNTKQRRDAYKKRLSSGNVKDKMILRGVFIRAIIACSNELEMIYWFGIC